MADPEFWSRVDAVFGAAVEIEGDPAAREALIAREAGGDEAVAAEVRSLLAAHDRSGAFLGPAAGLPEPPAPGTLVGVYRLVEKIGEGGMGDVYRAERADGLFGRDVAVKVTRGGLLDPGAAARFATERQILATLQHPHIVTLLDGGTMPDGRAYLVMELVDGVHDHARTARDRRLRSRGAAGAVPPGLRRGALRAPARDRPSRSQACQRPRHRRRRAQGARLRRRQAARRGARRRADRSGPAAGAAHAELRQPGAAARPAGDDGVRRLRARRPALRAGHRRPAVRDHGPAARSRDRSGRPHRADAPERRDAAADRSG